VRPSPGSALGKVAAICFAWWGLCVFFCLTVSRLGEWRGRVAWGVGPAVFGTGRAGNWSEFAHISASGNREGFVHGLGRDTVHLQLWFVKAVWELSRPKRAGGGWWAIAHWCNGAKMRSFVSVESWRFCCSGSREGTLFSYGSVALPVGGVAFLQRWYLRKKNRFVECQRTSWGCSNHATPEIAVSWPLVLEFWNERRETARTKWPSRGHAHARVTVIGVWFRSTKRGRTSISDKTTRQSWREAERADFGVVRLHRIVSGIILANQSLYKLEK
jgi:hypothetical protein